MTYRCWKCTAQLESKRERFCRACGVGSPFDGARKVERLRRKLERARRFTSAAQGIGGCGFGLYILVYFLFVLIGVSNSVMTLMIGAWMGMNIVAYIAWGLSSNKADGLNKAYLKQEANKEKTHPAFRKQNVLLRPAVAPSSPNALLHPVESNVGTEPEVLLRTADADRQ